MESFFSFCCIYFNFFSLFFCSFFSGSEIPPLSAVFVAVAVCRFVLAKSRLCLFARNAQLQLQFKSKMQQKNNILSQQEKNGDIAATAWCRLR